MMKLIFLLIFIISQSVFATNPKEDFLEIASQEIPPYYFEKSPGEFGGFFYQVIKDVCDRAKLNCRFKIYPFRRVLQYLKQGDVHVCAPMAISTERKNDMNFSTLVYSSAYRFFGKKEVIDTITDIRLLTGNVGVHSPSSTSNALMLTKKEFNLKIHVKEETDVDMTFEKLKKGRYDLVFMNKDISEDWAKKNNTKESFFNSYSKYNSPIDYRIAFTKKILPSSQAKLLERFKKELTIYLKTPEFKRMSDSL